MLTDGALWLVVRDNSFITVVVLMASSCHSTNDDSRSVHLELIHITVDTEINYLFQLFRKKTYILDVRKIV